MKSIFISSTFKDMNGERDLVLSRVIPDLQIEAKKYGENVRGIDLRWGVDTTDLESDAGSEKILDVCFEEIDRCSPYMLIFLGDRYGWIPEESIVKNALKKHTKDFETDDYAKSVTALEIEYGMLADRIRNPEKCVVCFRDPAIRADEVYDAISEELIFFQESEDAKYKLQQLKEKIRQQFGKRVIEYTGSWELTRGRMVGLRTKEENTRKGIDLEQAIKKAFLEIFQKEWNERAVKNWIEQEERYAQAFYEKKIVIFRGREELILNYYMKIADECDALLIYGEDGCGKSSLVCKVAEKLKNDGKYVIPFFAGISESSCTVSEFLIRMIYALEVFLEEEYGEAIGEKEQLQNWAEEFEQRNIEETKLIEHFRKLCGQFKQPIWFCIDALEQLISKVNGKNIGEFLSLFPGNTKVLLSLGADDLDIKIWEYDIKKYSGKSVYYENIPELTAEERLKVIEGITNFYGKTIPKDVILAIEKKMFGVEAYNKKQVYSPLYLDLIVKRLNMMNYRELLEATDEKTLVAICMEVVNSIPENARDAVGFIIYTAMNRVVERIPALYGLEAMLDKVVGLIASTKEGIPKEALAYMNSSGFLQGVNFQQQFALISYDANVVEWFCRYLDDFLVIRKSGRVCFFNNTYRSAICSYMKLGVSWMYPLSILDYIDTLDVRDSFRMREGLRQAAALIEGDILRFVVNISDGETAGEFLRKHRINEWWAYRKIAAFFADFENYDSPEMKKTMEELNPGFYTKYMEEYLKEDGNSWKVKRKLLHFLLTEYKWNEEKLYREILDFILEEKEEGREDIELLLLCYEKLRRENKSYIFQCFDYSEKLYLREKIWENAKRMWEYCVEITRNYERQYFKEQHMEKDPLRREIFQSDSYRKMDRERCKGILRVAQEVSEICLAYQKTEEATVLFNLMFGICNDRNDSRLLEETLEEIWKICYEELEKQYLQKCMEDIFAEYEQLYKWYSLFSEEMREKYAQQRLLSLGYVLQNMRKYDGEVSSELGEKLEGEICEFLGDYAAYSQETGECYQQTAIEILESAIKVLEKFTQAGYELEYITLEGLEEFKDMISDSWLTFRKYAEEE